MRKSKIYDDDLVNYSGNQSPPLPAHNKLKETAERCLKCGEEKGLQGVAVTIGRKTFPLFYLCDKCGNVTVKELMRMIRSYEEKKVTR